MLLLYILSDGQPQVASLVNLVTLKTRVVCVAGDLEGSASQDAMSMEMLTSRRPPTQENIGQA